MKSWLGRVALLAVAASVVPACGGSSSSGGGGGLTYTSRGGTGTLQDGGTGGYFEAYNYGGNDVKILTSGSVNAIVALPAVVVPYLGTNVADITTNTTWNVGGELTAASTVVNVGGTVTGVRVRSGVTLTIQPNYDDSPADGLRDTVRVSFANSVYIEGTVVIDFRDSLAAGDSLSNDRSRCFFGGENLVIGSGGRVVMTGKNNLAGTGGSGGYFEDSGITGTVINRGTVDTSGGNGMVGGQAGDLYFGYGSYYGAYNTGILRANGGTGSAGNGGDAAGNLYFHADDGYGPCVNSGSLLAEGGSGTVDGGNGGYIDLYSYYGVLASSGTISSKGGSTTDAAGNGNGGSGGDLYVYAYGEVRFTGSVNTSGGNGAGTGDGGGGGYFYVYGSDDYTWGYGDSAYFGIYIGCSVNTNGGNGEYGGDAGYTYYERGQSYGYARPGKEPVCIVGHSTIDVRGGDGQVNGGDAGGSNYVGAYTDYDYTSTYYTGSIIISSAFDARGGNGTTGYGGDGAYVDVQTDSSETHTQGSDFGTFMSGLVDTSGGIGATTGGDAGGIYIYGRWNALVSGNMLSNGGNGGTGLGGYAQDIEIYSGGQTTSTGTVSATGGSSTSDDGNYGYSIYINGFFVTAGGSISARGGNGGAGAGDVGGDGGYVEIVSQENPTVFSASVNVTGGTGLAAGTNGDFWLDGIHVSGP